ncbi:hypothetical protein [Amycolatopsis minnesotensis]|uniref:Uncharacterized protein n=1 Tax=Amycolatopsis minnesotensis TaxID=337894 RepID=A0ABN2Q9Q0_9PSEU
MFLAEAAIPAWGSIGLGVASAATAVAALVVAIRALRNNRRR